MAKRADQRKFHYVYRIDRDDGKYYIGLHSTDLLEDGYFGSGTYLSNSLRYHGREKHKKTILEHFPTRQLAKDREKELITDEMRFSDPLCMNLAPGGGGGFKDAAHKKKATTSGNQSPNRDHKAANAKRQATFENRGTRKGGGPNFTGLSHTLKTKVHLSLVMSEKQTGEKNSQFGTCWVTNGVKPVKIKKEQLDEYLMKGYSRGRKKASVLQLVDSGG